MIKADNMYTLLSIDAWRTEAYSWDWNNIYTVEEDIYLSPETIKSPRRLLAFMRKTWLNESSKGKLEIVVTEYDIEIIIRSTKEPIYAFRPQNY